MISVELPISKSIANRLLILQAKCGDALMPVAEDMPDDVVLLHDVLQCLLTGNRLSYTFDIKNCGTAMRFLTAFIATTDGLDVVLDGSARMRERPIAPLVEALQWLGADIAYLEKTGFPPLRIRGRLLPIQPAPYRMPQVVSTQFISALRLVGIRVLTRQQSPYITMTDRIIYDYCIGEKRIEIERDWSSAAFWYEYIAFHGGELFMPGLRRDSLQGDSVVAHLFEPLGVETRFMTDGVLIVRRHAPESYMVVDFSSCPDLYPALALTCERLGVCLQACGTESLVYKESNRLQSIRDHRVNGDHRIAMALLAADYPCDDVRCITKSYPAFYRQWKTVISAKSCQ